MSIKDWIELIGFMTAIVISLVGVYFSIKNRKREAKSIETKTNLDEAQQASIVKQLADSTEEMYLKRIGDFKDDVRLLREELEASRRETAEARRETAQLEDFWYNFHQPWDRKFIQEAKAHGWDIGEPPSLLMFLHERAKKDENE